ncbi:MAG: phosphoglucosamine mutase, partial [Thermovirgaceae bacterium]
YVLDAMRSSGSNLGGEQSGHIIAGDFFPTGDGLGSGLLFLSACARLGEDTDTLVDRFGRYPQVLKNFQARDKDAFLDHPEVRKAISKASLDLGDLGRVMVRPSGTEPLVRVLVEARDGALLEAVSGALFERIAKVAPGAASGSFGGGGLP